MACGLSTVHPGKLSAATAYMLSEGEHRYTTGLQYASATQFFNQLRNRVPQGCTSKDYTWHNSYTYGYSYYYNVFGSVSWINRNCAAAAGSTGIGDVRVGVRGRLDKFRNGRTWELALTIPTGYNNQKVNRLGFGRIGLWGGVAWSTQNTGWEQKMPSYWEVGTGIQLWLGSPATQSRSFVKYSWRLDKHGTHRLSLTGRLNLSFRDGTPTFPVAFAGFPRFAGDFDSGVISAKYSRKLTDKWSIAPAFGLTVWGRNTSASWHADLSITRQWKN
jgi:hypothetical protein